MLKHSGQAAADLGRRVHQICGFLLTVTLLSVPAEPITRLPALLQIVLASLTIAVPPPATPCSCKSHPH